MQLVKTSQHAPLMYHVSATNWQGALGQMLEPGCGALDRSLNHAVPQFPHPYNGNSRTDLRGLWEG